VKLIVVSSLYRCCNGWAAGADPTIVSSMLIDGRSKSGLFGFFKKVYSDLKEEKKIIFQNFNQ
jgi:hypothetical protein